MNPPRALLLFVSTILVLLIQMSLAIPAKSQSRESDAGNLRLTFENPGDVPSAFFDSPPAVERVDRADSPVPRRISYSACNDGSGGLCVSDGQCPVDKKPRNNNVGACGARQECCFGVPDSDKFCGSRGGECVPEKNCGGAPKLTGTDCNRANGEVCCIWV